MPLPMPLKIPMAKTGIYALTIFTSAFLLFMVQPLFSKIVLPSLGGATAVWITLMFVYQGLLLLGYGYAHALSHWLPQRLQVPTHLILLAASFLTLPLAAHADLTLPADAEPISWLIKTALMGVGLPFFMLSATSPLIQHWFAHTPHGKNKNPYVLYAVSNLGSLIALLGYPLVLERFLELPTQSNSWLVIYGLYALLLVFCGVVTHTLWRKTRTKDAGKATADPLHGENLAPTKTPKLTVVHWLFLSLVPSSLLLGVTGYITTQITSLPLLWVVPLALYLLTFIVAFSERQVIAPSVVRTIASIGLAGVLVIALFQQMYADKALLWHLMTFFFMALGLHQILASKKPAASKLTGFYFIMSLGGVLGGAVNALAAPLLFNNVYEYPLMLAIAGVLLWPYQKRYITSLYESEDLAKGVGIFFDIAVPLGLFVLATIPGHLMQIGQYTFNFKGEQNQSIALLVALVLVALSLQKPFRLAAGAGLVLAGGLFINTLSDSHTLTVRSFYSTYSVVFDDEALAYKMLTLGTSATQGSQSINPENALKTTYFYNLDGAEKLLPASVYAADWASIGLGVGTLACLSPIPNKTTFIEIDPMVYGIAHDSGYFTYLRDCPGENPVIIGDGRAKLASEFAEHSLGAIALDAFSGSSIPAHILTHEAFEMYLSKLKDDGVILVNISNRHINLLPLLTRQAADLDLHGVHRLPHPPKYSHWMILSRDANSIAALKQAGWKDLPKADMSLRPWTDSFATILPLLHSDTSEDFDEEVKKQRALEKERAAENRVE